MKQIATFYTADSLESFLISVRGESSVGFVPTMGALHHGHLSLVEKAKEMCDIVVVSIFVNPSQFNNQEDLEKYPRTLENDVKLLSILEDVVVFAPNVAEVYPKWHTPIKLSLGELANVMEGEFRPGHFDGVVDVVKRLFDIVLPDLAFFGRKDFQQLAIIQRMVEILNLNVTIIPCDIIREPSGLASSSRNVRLSNQEKGDATILYNVLLEARSMAKSHSVDEVEQFVEEKILNSSLLLEYFQIVDPSNLQHLTSWVPGAHACIAAHCGPVRLIDNMQIN